MMFPVIAMRRNQDTGKVEAATLQTYGTAFPIAPGLFLTAGHVVRAAASDGRVCLSRVPSAGGAMPSYPATAEYVIAEFDIGLLRVNVPGAVPIPLAFENTLDNFDDVEATGFPMAVDPEWGRVIPRSFKGSVIARRTVFELPGQPAGYEVTFPTPPGLSGAPLIKRSADGVVCHGIVISQVGIGTAERSVQVGLALDILILLSLSCADLGGPLATIWRMRPQPRPEITEKLWQGGFSESDTSDWPES